jgi:hypothetical protein
MEEHVIYTPLGKIVVHIERAGEYPGIWIDLRREGHQVDAPLALVEYTATEGDLDEPAIITRIWDDVGQEEHQTRVVHSGIEKYFEEDDQ